MLQDEPLTVPQVCAMLGIHKTTAYKMIKSGDLEAFHIGTHQRGIRILRSTVESYKKNHRIKPAILL
jgi:excisionase family DNA binding protein